MPDPSGFRGSPRRAAWGLVTAASLLGSGDLAGVEFSTQALAPGWSVETVYSGLGGSDLDLELDSRGMEHVVFHDSYHGGIEYRRRTAPGVWEDWSFPYSGNLVQLDFDPADDRGYVLFQENVTSDLVLAWKGADGAWTSTTAMTATDFVYALSFEMRAGTAHIALTNDESEILYRHFDPDGFSYTVPIDQFFGPVLARPSLALRSDGLPRITYNLDGELYYALTADTVDWGAQLVDDSSPSVGLYSSLALAADDTPFISYQDATHSALKLATKVLFQWVDTEVDGGTAAVGAFTSLALDPSSQRPRIAHRGSQCPVCFAARQANGTWTRTVVTDTTVPTAARKLVLTANGEARIAFAADDGVYLAVQTLRIFADGFESGDTSAWTIP